MFKRYLIEIGMGTDLHGGDVTKAAVRAVEDARRRGCMAGLVEVLDIGGADAFKIKVKICSPRPEDVDTDKVSALFEGFGRSEVTVVEGGAAEKGLYVEQFGEGDTIVVVNAVLTIMVDMDHISLKTGN